MNPPLRLAVLLSGGGRTLQNLLDRTRDGRLAASVRIVLADRPAGGLDRARAAGIPAFVERDAEAIYERLQASGAELVVLAGYLRLLPIREPFVGRVLNIHPALLPAHGGKGMHGMRVHEAVLAAGDRESGCTVHVCDAEYDHGPIVLQRRVPVLPGDTPQALADRVFEAECEAFPEAIALYGARLRAKPTRDAGSSTDVSDASP